MKASYAMLVMILCLNLATWGTEQAGIFTSSSMLTPLDPATEEGKFNGTEAVDTIIHSQDPTGGTDYVNAGLGLLGGAVGGMIAGFPLWALSIPWVPSYVAWMVIIVEGYVYLTFIIELAMGRDITGE